MRLALKKTTLVLQYLGVHIIYNNNTVHRHLIKITNKTENYVNFVYTACTSRVKLKNIKNYQSAFLMQNKPI